MVTVRAVRLLRCSTPQSGKPSVQSVCSVQFVHRSTITRALWAQLAFRRHHPGVDCMLIGQMRSTWVGGPKRDGAQSPQPNRGVRSPRSSLPGEPNSRPRTSVRTLEPSWSRSRSSSETVRTNLVDRTTQRRAAASSRGHPGGASRQAACGRCRWADEGPAQPRTLEHKKPAASTTNNGHHNKSPHPPGPDAKDRPSHSGSARRSRTRSNGPCSARRRNSIGL